MSDVLTKLADCLHICEGGGIVIETIGTVVPIRFDELQ